MPKRKRVEEPSEFDLGIVAAPAPAKAAKPSRQAARAAQQSQVQRFVDEETRRAVQLARLDALEADNYGEDEREPLNLEASGLYVDDGDAGAGSQTVSNAGRKKKKAAAAGAGAMNVAQRRLLNARGFLRRVEDIAASEVGAVTDEAGRLQRDRKAGGKPVFRPDAVMTAKSDPPFDALSGGPGAGAGAGSTSRTGVEEATGNTARWAESAHHYLAAAAPPAKRPPVPFCGVCGNHGRYTCTRCGDRVCSKACTATHAETRCMK